MKNEVSIGYENLRKWEKISAGIRFNEIVGILGEPVREIKAESGHWYYFKTSSLAAGPICARGNRDNNTIVELRCTEDGPPNWIIDYK